MPPELATRGHGLVVERDMIVGMGLADDLAELGYRVSGPFIKATDVFDLLSSDPPDFAIVDVALRDGSGRQAAEAIRQRAIPLVLFSAGDRRAYRDGLFEGVPWVEKPASTELLLAALGQTGQTPPARGSPPATG